MTLTERNKENTLESLDDYLDSDICIYIHTLPSESFYKKADIFFAKQVHRPQLPVFQEEQLQNFQPSGPNWSMTGQAMAVPRLPGSMPGISSDGFGGKLPKKQNMSFFEGAFLKPERAPSSSSNRSRSHQFSGIFQGGYN